MYKDDTILVVGQAKPSKEDAIYSLHGEFYVSFVVERTTGNTGHCDPETPLQYSLSGNDGRDFHLSR